MSNRLTYKVLTHGQEQVVQLHVLLNELTVALMMLLVSFVVLRMLAISNCLRRLVGCLLFDLMFLDTLHLRKRLLLYNVHLLLSSCLLYRCLLLNDLGHCLLHEHFWHLSLVGDTRRSLAHGGLLLLRDLVGLGLEQVVRHLVLGKSRYHH